MPSLMRLKLVHLAGNGDSVAIDAPNRICQISPKMEFANSGQEAEFHPGCERPLERPEGRGPAQPRARRSLPKPGRRRRKTRIVPRKLSARWSGALTLEHRLVYRTAGGPPRVAQCQRQSSTDLGLRRPIGAMGSGRPPCRTVAPLSPGLNTPAPTHPSVAPNRPPGTRVTGRSRSPDPRHADGPPSRSRGPSARGRKPHRRRSRAQPAPCP